MERNDIEEEQEDNKIIIDMKMMFNNKNEKE